MAWSYRRQDFTLKRREGKSMRKDKMLKKSAEFLLASQYYHQTQRAGLLS